MRSPFFPVVICLGFISLANSLPLQPCQSAQPAPQLNAALQSPRITINTITFGGQTAVSPDELSAIATSLTQRTFKDSPQWIDNVRAQILDAWQHLGYFRAQIADARAETRSENPTEKRFAVVATLDAGQFYRLKEIGFRKASQFTAAELRAMFPINKGDLLDTHKLQDGMANLRKGYGAKGFINVAVVPAFTVDEANATVSLDLEIMEGLQYRLSQIRVLGLDPLTTQQLLRESSIEQGKIFDAALLQDFLSRNKGILPQDTSAEDNVQRVIDDQHGTVEIALDFRNCRQSR